MISAFVIVAGKNCGELGRRGKLRIGMTRSFGELRVFIRYCVWSAWGKNITVD
jgi:hypothetical protein